MPLASKNFPFIASESYHQPSWLQLRSKRLRWGVGLASYFESLSNFIEALNFFLKFRAICSVNFNFSLR